MFALHKILSMPPDNSFHQFDVVIEYLKFTYTCKLFLHKLLPVLLDNAIPYIITQIFLLCL